MSSTPQPRARISRLGLSPLTLLRSSCSAAVNNSSSEGVAIKKVTNVFSKKILAKRALREIKLLQHFRGHRNVSDPAQQCATSGRLVSFRLIAAQARGDLGVGGEIS